MFCGENLQCLAAVEAAISMVFVIVEFPFIKCNVETSDRIVEEQVPFFIVFSSFLYLAAVMRPISQT